jgi:glycosyltransferase involved in cell wall biosynthesis
VRISVIVFSCDQAPYLVEAIDSVLAQTYPPAEIVVSDDASRDGSVELIQRYETEHPGRIRGVYHPRRLGIAPHKTAALRQARGEWITSLDGDDRFLPAKLELEAGRLRDRPTADFVYSNFRIVDSAGNVTGIWAEAPQPEGDVFCDVFTRNFPKRMVFRNELVRRSCCESLGYFDPSRRTHEDWDFKIRLSHTFQGIYNPVPAMDYRRHDAAISRRLAPEILLAEMGRVYRKNRPLLDRLPAAGRRETERALLRFFRTRVSEIVSGYRRQGRPLSALRCRLRFGFLRLAL